MKIAALLLFSSAVSWADLAEIKAEPSADKRAVKALDYAGRSLQSMRENLNGTEKLKASIAEFDDCMKLMMDSFAASGKNPAKNPKDFKKAELRLREYMRKLKTLEHDLNFDERPMIKPIIEHVEKIQDYLVEGLMRKH